MREPIHRSCSSLEVSYVSISKSSITLRCFNMSLRSITDCICKDTKDFDNKLVFLRKFAKKMFVQGKSVSRDSTDIIVITSTLTVLSHPRRGAVESHFNNVSRDRY